MGIRLPAPMKRNLGSVYSPVGAFGAGRPSEALHLQSRNNSYFLLLVVALLGLSIWGFVQKPLQRGLDVVGGVRLTYEMADLSPEQKQNVAEIQSNLQRILTNRASNALGVAEPQVYKKGSDQLVVELPGFTNIEEAKSTISTTAKVVLYHANTVSSERRQKRYEVVDQRKEKDGVPYVTFARRSAPDRELDPYDPDTKEAYAEMIASWGQPILEGEDVVDATPQVNGTRTQPFFRFSGKGSRALEQWSRRYRNQGEQIAFVLDGKVLSIAPLKDETILKDNAVIDGEFDPTYVRHLTELVKAGSLPVSLTELSQQTVDPTIGKQAWDRMITAAAISIAGTCLFLIVYYAFPGVIALIALLIYMLFTLTVLKLIGATFSLASMAAFVLSVAMAVDANILVFERVKEEIRVGRTLMTAVELGFKRALSAIIDSNACTILTSIVLWNLGTGPVKGFASTLIIGVALSFFTAVTITRSLLVGSMSMGWFSDPKYFALGRSWFGERLEAEADKNPLPIIKNTKRYFIFSGVLIVLAWIFVPMGGVKLSVEFLGGFEGVYKTNANVGAPQIRQSLEQNGLKGVNVKLGKDMQTGTSFAYVTVPYGGSIAANDPQANEKIATAANLPLEGSSFTEIGPTIQKETVNNAILGVLLSSALIVLYLTIRFGFALGGVVNGLKFGLSAIAALLHDVVFLLGSAGLFGFIFGWEISALYLTAMLTVIGFSVHDTIVIFDRIRENLRKAKKGEDFGHLIDRSVTQTLARSLNTSMTAIFSLIVLIAIGTPTPELKFMCVTMLTGIVIGTYSSIFNASPVLYLWDRSVRNKRGEQAGLVAETMRDIQVRAQGIVMPDAQRGSVPPEGGQAYGQIKRRSKVEQSTRNIDEDD